MAVADVRPGSWIDERGQVRTDTPAPAPALPATPAQIVEVIPGSQGVAVELRCLCRKLLFRWKASDQSDTGAVEIEIRCPRCRTTTLFRLPTRGAIDSA